VVVGLMIGVGLSFLLEYLDNTIKNEMDVEKVLGLPLLGAITTIGDKDKMNPLNNKIQSRARGESVGV
jgi:capsular polysaccharide biosynthesis protein